MNASSLTLGKGVWQPESRNESLQFWILFPDWKPVFRGPCNALAPQPVCSPPHARRSTIHLSGPWANVRAGLEVPQPCGVGRDALRAQTNRETAFAFKSQVPPASVIAGAREKKQTNWNGGSSVADRARSVSCKRHRGTLACQARLNTVSPPKLHNSSRS